RGSAGGGGAGAGRGGGWGRPGGAVAWVGAPPPGGRRASAPARGPGGAGAGARRCLLGGPALRAAGGRPTGGGGSAAGAAPGPGPVGTPLAHSNRATTGFECATLVRMREAGRTGGGTVESFVVATAGHVDHGKSALVRALTGIEPDRLAEEHRRGLTVDLGFAWTELVPSCQVAF